MSYTYSGTTLPPTFDKESDFLSSSFSLFLPPSQPRSILFCLEMFQKWPRVIFAPTLPLVSVLSLSSHECVGLGIHRKRHRTQSVRILQYSDACAHSLLSLRERKEWAHSDILHTQV
jgi:hypothetical protein